jgi:hypothetical protein
MNKSPAAIVKDHFGDKAKLVAALGPFTHDDLWTPRLNEKKGLGRVSNAKLLRLFNVLSAVKEKFGTRFKLVDAICELEKRTKDEGYRNRLLSQPVPRVYDLYRSVARRAGKPVEPMSDLATRLPARASDDSEPQRSKTSHTGGGSSAAGKGPTKKTAGKATPEKAKGTTAKATAKKSKG